MLASLRSKLIDFWSCLPQICQVICPLQASRRFTEMAYLREDLVGSYKGRKYLSLVPWIEAQGYKRVALQGSSHSSNLLQLSLKLVQAGIEPVYQLEGREGPPAGNGLLSRLVLGKNFKDVPPEQVDWTVPEGAGCPQALAGSLGLVGSLVHHVLESNEVPDSIYIDSGTGYTAASLLLGLNYFELSCRVVVVTMTRQKQEDIWAVCEDLGPEFERLMGSTASPCDFELTGPPLGQSFGSTPSKVFQEIEEAAQKEGLLLDPLYSAKLSLAYRELRKPEEKAFVFVSGGQTDLLNFQGPLRKWRQASY